MGRDNVTMRGRALLGAALLFLAVSAVVANNKVKVRQSDNLQWPSDREFNAEPGVSLADTYAKYYPDDQLKGSLNMEKLKGELMGDLDLWRDIKQGAYGNCFTLAALGSLFFPNPSADIKGDRGYFNYIWRTLRKEGKRVKGMLFRGVPLDDGKGMAPAYIEMDYTFPDVGSNSANWVKMFVKMYSVVMPQKSGLSPLESLGQGGKAEHVTQSILGVFPDVHEIFSRGSSDLVGSLRNELRYLLDKCPELVTKNGDPPGWSAGDKFGSIFLMLVTGRKTGASELTPDGTYSEVTMDLAAYHGVRPWDFVEVTKEILEALQALEEDDGGTAFNNIAAAAQQRSFKHFIGMKQLADMYKYYNPRALVETILECIDKSEAGSYSVPETCPSDAARAFVEEWVLPGNTPWQDHHSDHSHNKYTGVRVLAREVYNRVVAAGKPLDSTFYDVIEAIEEVGGAYGMAFEVHYTEGRRQGIDDTARVGSDGTALDPVLRALGDSNVRVWDALDSARMVDILNKYFAGAAPVNDVPRLARLFRALERQQTYAETIDIGEDLGEDSTEAEVLQGVSAKMALLVSPDTTELWSEVSTSLQETMLHHDDINGAVYSGHYSRESLRIYGLIRAAAKEGLPMTASTREDHGGAFRRADMAAGIAFNHAYVLHDVVTKVIPSERVGVEPKELHFVRLINPWDGHQGASVDTLAGFRGTTPTKLERSDGQQYLEVELSHFSFFFYGYTICRDCPEALSINASFIAKFMNPKYWQNGWWGSPSDAIDFSRITNAYLEFRDERWGDYH